MTDNCWLFSCLMFKGWMTIKVHRYFCRWVIYPRIIKLNIMSIKDVYTFNKTKENLTWTLLSCCSQNVNSSLKDCVKLVQMLESGRSSRIIATEFNVGPFNFWKSLHVFLTMLSCKLFRWTQYNAWNIWVQLLLNMIEKGNKSYK